MCCENLTSVSIPNSVELIGARAFEECISLISINIPSKLTFIDERVFSHCKSLTAITIPNTITSIGNSAFEGCKKPANITIPDSVTEIESYAFYSCDNLSFVIIPSTVTKIGEDAFWSCDNLGDIYYTGSEEEWSIAESDGYSYFPISLIRFNYVPDPYILSLNTTFSEESDPDTFTDDNANSTENNDTYIPDNTVISDN